LDRAPAGFTIQPVRRRSRRAAVTRGRAMTDRDRPASAMATRPPRDLILRTPPNWTAVVFLAILAGLHFANAASSLWVGRWAGYLSLIFGSVLSVVTVGIYFFRFEMAFLREPRVVRMRHGIGRASFERFLRFRDVRAVRLTLDDGGSRRDAAIELLCPLEDVLCPPTRIPRQEALYLAMLMEVPLVKVSSGADAASALPISVDESPLETGGARMLS
jgi:hypothetical protein